MCSDRTRVTFYQMSDVYMCPRGVSLYSIPPQALAIFCLLPHQAGAVGRKNFGGQHALHKDAMSIKISVHNLEPRWQD